MSWTYGDSERLDRARRRKQRDQKVGLGLAIGCVLVVIVTAWWLISRSAPEPPRITIAWPSPEKFGRRTFTPVVSPESSDIYNVAALAIRRGQPFTVTVEQSADWTVRGISDETDERSANMHWSPLKNGAVLKIFCRAKATGLQKLVAWSWPTWELRIHGLLPQPQTDGRLSLQIDENLARQGVLLAGNTALKAGQTSAIWDDRIVPLLGAVDKAIPVPVVRAEASTVVETPIRWHISEGFDGKRAAKDTATYFVLETLTGSAEDDLQMTTRLARFFVAREPKATLKFIIDENEPASTVFRMAFDGKGARGGWIKRSGERAASPIRWWDQALGAGPSGERLSPSPVRR